MTLPLPPAIRSIADAVLQAGGQPYAVGGVVRDHLLGRPSKDWDIEVYGLPAEALERALRPLGPVSAVGRAFGVLKVRLRALEVDVSLPRRDSQVGPGHRGVLAQGDPFMDLREATRRRDLTVNAILVDLRDGAVVDPFGGQRDLERRRLRAVDDATFLDDPLRALRVVQLAARLDFGVEPGLLALCRRAPLHDLPAERIETEWRKLLLRASRPSVGLVVARDADILRRVFPTLHDAPDADAAVDRLAARAPSIQPRARRYAALLTTWLARTSVPDAEAVLDRLNLFKVERYALRDAVLAALGAWAHPFHDDAALRWLSTHAEVELVLRARLAHTPDNAPAFERALDRAGALGVLDAPPAALLRGKDLRSLGFHPGPAMGDALRHVYAQQLDGMVHDTAGAQDAARRWLAEHHP